MVIKTYQLRHGTIIQTGITRMKSLVMCATQLAGDLFLKMVKYVVVS